MPFYSNIATDPKRSFRFLFYLAGDKTLRPYTVKQVKKPTFQLEGGPQIKYIQHSFKYPGRVVWQDVSVTVVDPGGSEDAGAALYNMLAIAGYSVPRGPIEVDSNVNNSISKGKANTAMGVPLLTQIDAEGNMIEEWTMHNAFLSNVDFGEVNYDTDDIMNITLTIMYDYATLRTAGPGAAMVDARVRSK